MKKVDKFNYMITMNLTDNEKLMLKGLDIDGLSMETAIEKVLEFMNKEDDLFYDCVVSIGYTNIIIQRPKQDKFKKYI